MASQALGGVRPSLQQARRSMGQSRSFTASTVRRRNGPLAKFPPTSSPELDAILSTLRNNVFIPSHLRETQRNLIYRKSFQHYLTGDEPISVELPIVGTGQADVMMSAATPEEQPKESFVLQPVNRLRDEPKTKATFAKIVDLLRGHPEDWHIMPQLLREFHLSGRSFNPRQIEKLVRRATLDGQLGMMMESFRQVDDLGVKMSTVGIARKVMLSAHERAVMADWGERELDKAIKNTEVCLLLAQDPKHVEGVKDKARNCPEIYGAAMALVAARRWLWQINKVKSPTAKTADATPVVEMTTDPEEKTGETTEVATPTLTDAYTLGKGDIPRIEDLAKAMLDRSGAAVLEADESKPETVRLAISNWLPAWFGIQLATRVLPESSESRKRLQGAYRSDIEPLIKKVLPSLGAAASKGRWPREVKLHRAYQKLLA